ncbi:MAG: PASTA domain-containing protein, partial [Actinomycetota bacterium]
PAPSTDPAADESTPPPALFDDAPPRRRKGPIVLLVVVLLAGLAGLGYAATLLFQPKSFAVPALAGQPVDRALNQIAGNGWEISYEFERSDSFPTPEQVIRTEPEPGAELEEGEPFLIVRSQGPEFRLLPEVVDRSFDEAAVELTGLGLRVVEAPEREFSETLALGSVVSWQVVGDATLTAGDQILPGETVQLTLSAGPAPRSVPSFAGNTLDEAVAAADQVQLRVVSGAGVFSDDVPEGRVVSQEPAAGAELARDGTITVQLSLGPDVVPLPDLEGLSFTDAQAALDEAGFVIGRLLGTTAGTFVELTIEGDDVAPGTEFPRGTVVDVIFL